MWSNPALAAQSKQAMAFSRANLLVKGAKPYLAYCRHTQVDEVRYNYELRKFFVTLQIDRHTKRYQFDNVISNTGTRREQVYYNQLVPNEPGFFQIGAQDCDGPERLLRTGHEEIRQVFRSICEDPSLDCYVEGEKAA